MSNIYFRLTVLVGAFLTSVCLPATAESPPESKSTSVDSSAEKPTASLTPAQKAELVARKKKWLLAQRTESGGTGEGAWRLIKKPMDLPNLPQYTGAGATFVEGLMYPNKPGGAAISLTYRAKEAPDVVMSWYEEALANYHWKIQKIKAENANLTAFNGDNGVTVAVRPAKLKAFRTDIKITFKLARK